MSRDSGGDGATQPIRDDESFNPTVFDRGGVLPAPDDPLQPGRLLGRYAIIEEVGRGGMGVVLRAYDPKLQREVALKVVRVVSTEAEVRLIREARAMAQLSHPNVVAIYDVIEGEELGPAAKHPKGRGAQVVLAMEYVAGTTLTKWRRQQERSPDEIVDAFVAAGRGLAAAHREGLLHRDFKPDNVLVGDDKRVRVTDFGLARGAGTRDSSATPEPSLSAQNDVDTMALTAAGTVMGTPRYMPPEQHRARDLGPAADQFAFCVALWEALAGEPPFKGTLIELLEAKRAGPPAWPRGRAAPARVVDAIRRGLQPKANERHTSMEALLARLDRPPVSRGRTGAVVLSVAAVGGVAAWAALASRDDGPTVCSGAADRMQEVWGEDRRDEVREAFASSPVSYAGGVWERLAPRLDGYAEDWVEMRTDACEATRLRGDQSEAVMDLRIACLERARTQLDAAANVLSEPAAKTIERAHRLADGLPALEGCADIEALQAAVPPPEPGESERVDELRARLAEADARNRAGDFEGSFRAAETANVMLDGLAYEPIRTEALIAIAVAHDELARYDEAEAAFREASRIGAQWKQWTQVRRATLGLLQVLGYRKQQFEPSMALRDLALGLSAGDAKAEARTRSVIATVLGRWGRLEEAEREQRSVLQLRLDTLGAEHPSVASSRNNLGNALLEQGKYEEAEAEYRASLAARSAALGSDHPDVAASRNNLGLVLQRQGRLDDALVEHRAALALRERALGTEHPDSASSHNNIGMILHLQDQLTDAEAEYRLAIHLWEAALGEEHPQALVARSNLGALLIASGRASEGVAEHRTVAEIQTRVLGEEHPAVASSMHNLAIGLSRLGKLEEAEQTHRRVVQMRLVALGPKHPEVASSQNNLGNLLLARGKLEEAEKAHRAALALRLETLGPEHRETAASHFNLAEVLIAAERHEEAESELRESLRLRRAMTPPPAELGETLASLAEVLDALGQEGEAAQLRRERAALE